MGYAPLSKAEPFIVTARLDPALINRLEDVAVETTPGIALETPALRDPADGTVRWRMRTASNAAEPQSIVVSVAGEQVFKTVAAGERLKAFVPAVQKWNWEEGLIANAEGYLPAGSPLTELRVGYDRSEYWFLWWELDPVILFFIYTLVFAFGLKGIFGVVI
jgi:hypothetical protein